jgi:asparagine synthase (glutamine-hydrolysing)
VSGFAGIVHLDGSPVDQDLLQRLVDFQRFRGPDAQNVWITGHVGFGHTLLNVSSESENEHQPLSLDEETGIVCDCRVDDRPALITKLESRGHNGIAGAADAELILRAYNVWGHDCVQHLLGDFAFAIWDARQRRLFCGRDQMGVKPFYYAYVGSRLVFSNTLDCIRQHPGVSSVLNDLAIADFLLFDAIQEPGATSFRDIQRLLPAHTLTLAGKDISTRRYWTFPVSAPIHHTRSSDCVEEFRKLMDTAVAERLRTNSAGIMMSGGLDSATVAVAAQSIFSRNGSVPGLCAYTEVFDRLIPHEERHYAGLVAEALQIPIEFQTSDDSGVSKGLGNRDGHFPEPVHSPWSDWGFALLRQMAITQRIVLTGFGGDPTFSSLLTVHFLQLLKERHFGRLIADAARYLTAEGRFSRLYVRTRWRRWFPSKNVVPHYPVWLNPDLEKRLGLRQRWKTLNRTPAPAEGVRPVALESTLSSLWPALFEEHDSGVTRVPVEVRHPFFDLRLISFLLALPALPWCSDKELLREASRGVLPDAVRLRRKSPLIADPLIALLRRPESEWLDSFTPCADLAQFVQRNRIPKVLGERNTWNAWINLRPLSLNFWLRLKEPSGINN